MLATLKAPISFLTLRARWLPPVVSLLGSKVCILLVQSLASIPVVILTGPWPHAGHLVSEGNGCSLGAWCLLRGCRVGPQGRAGREASLSSLTQPSSLLCWPEGWMSLFQDE